MKAQLKREIRADLDPKTAQWILLGSSLGLAIWLCATPGWMPGHQILHERGVIQVFTMIFGGMVAGFLYLKWIILVREKRYTSRFLLDVPRDFNDKSISGALKNLQSASGVLAGRSAQLLDLWINSHSTEKIERRIESDTEAYDLAHQTSYSLPRILVWAIPVLGFIGTVIGIGDAVSGFQGFLSKVDDVDVLREGLIKVTTGLGTAFDTTFLALVISLIVMLPLAYLERQEQHLLTLIDLRLRATIFDILPDAQAASTINEEDLKRVINNAFKENLPSPEVLIEPAKAYAESSAQKLVRYLMPLGEMVTDTNLRVAQTRDNTIQSVEMLCREIDASTKQLTDSIQAIAPHVQMVSRVTSISDELAKQLASLETSGELRNTLTQLQESLGLLRGSLAEAAKPRRVVLMEER